MKTRRSEERRVFRSGVLTPTLTGAQPALYTVNGKTVRPLGQESDKSIALLNALDENQKIGRASCLPIWRSHSHPDRRPTRPLYGERQDRAASWPGKR